MPRNFRQEGLGTKHWITLVLKNIGESRTAIIIITVFVEGQIFGNQTEAVFMTDENIVNQLEFLAQRCEYLASQFRQAISKTQSSGTNVSNLLATEIAAKAA